MRLQRIPILKGVVVALIWTLLSVQYQLWHVHNHASLRSNHARLSPEKVAHAIHSEKEHTPEEDVDAITRSNLVVSAGTMDSPSPVSAFAPDSSVWNDSPVLPTWMKRYFRWHNEQSDAYKSASLDKKNSTDYQFLVVRCLATDTKCGGTADRLAPAPFLILLACRMKRILLIHWERPSALDEFLVPVSIDWRVPGFLAETTNWKRTPRLTVMGDILSVLDPNYSEEGKHKRRKKLPKVLPQVVTVLFQTNDHGAALYDQYRNQTQLLGNEISFDEHREQPTFHQVYSDTWKVLFRPSPPVQTRIDKSLQELQLVPGHYVAVHIRALYQQAAGPKKTIFVAKNALHCASQLRFNNTEPIYVTTDSPNSTKAALDYAATDHPNDRVVARATQGEVLHLDRGVAFLSKNVSAWTTSSSLNAYYDTFVDLYLLANARCRSIHLGNFAKWASLMSNYSDCTNNHLFKQCRWKK